MNDELALFFGQAVEPIMRTKDSGLGGQQQTTPKRPCKTTGSDSKQSSGLLAPIHKELERKLSE